MQATSSQVGLASEGEKAMDTIPETKDDIVRLDRLGDPQAAALAHDRKILEGTDQPKPEWVRGACPQCGQPVVANCYYVGGRGYLAVRECWASLGENPTCGYRKVL